MTQPPVETEGGFALIEILVSVAILGIAFVAILGGLATAINTSELHRQQAEVDAVLVSAVEGLKALETGVPCAGPTEPAYLDIVRAAATAEGWPGSTVSITDITHWDGDDYLTACPRDGLLGLLRLQRITVQVTHRDGRVTNELTFVKDSGLRVAP
ncbi:MAG: type II secretion system protein [Acidimicrobiales bacterium]